MARMDKDAYMARRMAGRPAEGLMPRGGRVALAQTAKELVERAGDEMRADFAGDDEFRKQYVASIKQGALDLDRTCVKIVSQIYKLVGEERKLVVEFVHSLGAKSEDELRRMVEAVKAAEGADVLDGVERATAYLEAALTIHPEHRTAVVLRLGGVVPIPGSERV